MRKTAVALSLAILTACASAPMADEVCAADVNLQVYDSETNPAVVAPVVLRRVAPDRSRDGIPSTARAIVEAVIGEDGIPRNICVTSGNPAWGRALAAALREWTFKPGTLDGKPVPVKFTLTATYRG